MRSHISATTKDQPYGMVLCLCLMLNGGSLLLPIFKPSYVCVEFVVVLFFYDNKINIFYLLSLSKLGAIVYCVFVASYFL